MSVNISAPKTSFEARERLMDLLQTDLIGPDPDKKGNTHAPMLDERLDQAPTSWYLTGFLAPTCAPHLPAPEGELEQGAEDELGAGEALKKVSPDESDESLKTPSTTAFASTMGLSVYVPEEAQTLHITASWGDYERHFCEEQGEEQEGNAQPSKVKLREEWQRHHRSKSKQVSLNMEGLERGVEIELPQTQWLAHSGHVALHVLVKPIPNSSLRSVSCHLINRREPDGERPRDEAFLFQTKLSLSLSRRGELKPRQEELFEKAKPTQASLQLSDQHVSLPFSPAPDLSLTLKDTDDDYLDQARDALIYRTLPRYGTGHHCALQAEPKGGAPGEEGLCYRLYTTWRPTANVLFVKHTEVIGLNTRMDHLGKVKTHKELSEALAPLISAYEAWIAEREVERSTLNTTLQEVAQGHLDHHREALAKIKLGVDVLKDERAFDAFTTMNRVIRAALRQQQKVRWLEADTKRKASDFKASLASKENNGEPAWRLFQLAFILMNLPGLTVEDYEGAELESTLSFENEQVDLLFFPTGGGKTEAYLGLSAFTLLLRRLRDPSRNSGGVSVLMRYTLRLLTLDQLGRIATLICALDLERQRRVEALGAWPFEIGLWVGQQMTPNRLAPHSASDRNAAVHKIEAFQEDSKEVNYPFPLRLCPWCGSKLNKDSFDVRPSLKDPQDLLLSCPDEKSAQGLKCHFKVRSTKKGEPPQRGIPVLMIDSMIYQRLPAFLIATVDKFAQLPWRQEVGALFGQVTHADEQGYTNSATSSGAQALSAGRLPPPRLIIQDELHLISGPLGTMVGLYEVAINQLCAVEGFTKPKIVASTATARRAEQQVKALYGRNVRVFPPPGLKVSDTFFSQQAEHDIKTPARQYVGLSAPGRSHKGVQLVASLTLLAGAKTLWDLAQKEGLSPNPVDPYMTIVGYYNTLRELGGSRRIAEDEIASRLTQYSERKRIKGDIFEFADRASLSEIVELTSRVSSAEVAESKERLAEAYSPLSKSRHVDLALATNMISVGLDISRLGLMMVLGQPKAAAEYIQATSRVGRDKKRPGLVVTLLNHHRSRDRAHFQEFQTWHESFYRRVEANSLTPFSSRALERGFVGAAVGLARHLTPLLTAPLSPKLIRLPQGQEVLDDAIKRFQLWVGNTLTSQDAYETEEAKARIKEVGERLKAHWEAAVQHYQGQVQYGKERPATEKPLLTRADEPSGDPVESVQEGALAAPMSLRDVEPSVGLWRIDHISDPKEWPYRVSSHSKAFQRPPNASVRRSQLVTTFGPGAMLDLPECSAIVNHTNSWNRAFEPLKEPRLSAQVAQILSVPDIELYEPRVDSKTAMSGVGYAEFPGWMLVNTEEHTHHEGERYRRRLLIKRTNGKLKTSTNKMSRSGKLWKGKVKGKDKTIYDVVPIRFVQACPKGHLSDIDWAYFVHQGAPCGRDDLYFDEAGSGHNFVKILVACPCGKKRKLADAKKPKGLGRCNGGQPWIRLSHRDGCLEKCGDESCSHARCTEDAHLLTRTATNAYFSSVVSVLSLPPQGQEGPQSKGAMYREAIKAHGLEPKSFNQGFVNVFLASSDTQFYQILKAFDEQLLSQPEQVWADIQALQAELAGEATEEQKASLKGGKITRPEVDQLMSIPTPKAPGERFSVEGFEQFEAERLMHTKKTPSWFAKSVERVILMHRLREVSALVGFTRLEPLAGEDDIPIAQQMQIERAPLVKGKPRWVPAVENLGEGVFLSLNTQRVKAWASSPEVQARMASFERGRELMERESISKRGVHARDAAYVLLHTLAHALIEEIALSCGYSSSSLKERIYSFDDVYGLLIYTGTPSADGTLGGLVDQCAQLSSFVAGALKRLTLCSSDPICSAHEPEDQLTKRYLHGAACHSCALISETSCSARNLWLDRAFVVPTLEVQGASFFSEVDIQALDGVELDHA